MSRLTTDQVCSKQKMTLCTLLKTEIYWQYHWPGTGWLVRLVKGYWNWEETTLQISRFKIWENHFNLQMLYKITNTQRHTQYVDDWLMMTVIVIVIVTAPHRPVELYEIRQQSAVVLKIQSSRWLYHHHLHHHHQQHSCHRVSLSQRVLL